MMQVMNNITEKPEWNEKVFIELLILGWIKLILLLTETNRYLMRRLQPDGAMKLPKAARM